MSGLWQLVAQPLVKGSSLPPTRAAWKAMQAEYSRKVWLSADVAQVMYTSPRSSMFGCQEIVPRSKTKWTQASSHWLVQADGSVHRIS